MGKRPSTYLPELVKSMRGNESRTFSLYMTRTTSKNQKLLIELYKAVRAQKEFDNDALKVAVYGSKKLQTKKFEELKRALYDNLLKSLQLSDATSSVTYELKDILLGIKILAKRSLYNHCRRLIKKGKTLAYKYEAFTEILELIAWQKKIAYAESDIDYLDKNLAALTQEEKDCFAKIQTEIQYNDIYYQLLIQSKKQATLRNDEKKEQLKIFFDTPLLNSDQYATTYRSKVLYHRSLGYYYFNMGRYEDFYQKNIEIIELIESQPFQLKEDPSHYISVLSNQVFCSGMLRKYEKVDFYLEKMKASVAVTLDDKFKIFTQYFLNKLIQCAEAGNFKQGLDIIKQREVEKKAFDKELFKHNFYFLYAYMNFGAGHYETTIDWLNELLNLPKTAARSDLQSMARILNLITHFEMGNTLLMEYLQRSTYRYLRANKRMFETEKCILRFIKKSAKFIYPASLKKAFIKLKVELEALQRQPSEAPIFRYFNFIAWVDSHINQENFDITIKRGFHNRK